MASSNKASGEKTKSKVSVLPILKDRPEIDRAMGFDTIIEAVMRLICDNADRGPGFTVGVFGPWGSGKSSILRAVRQRLEKGENASKFIVVPFEAWRYGDSKLLMLELLRQLASSLTSQGVSGGGKLDKVLNYASTALGAVVSPLLGMVGGSQLGLPDKLVEALYEFHNNESSLSADKHEADLYDVLGSLAQELKKDGRHAVFIIDDLDRCAPEGVAQIIGTLNTLMDYERFIFILGLDRSYLVNAITDAYNLHDKSGAPDPVSGERFLEKIIQIPLTVPTLDFSEISLRGFVGPEVMGALKRQFGFKKKEVDLVQETIIPYALRSNPRQVKRFLNSYMVSYFINRDTIKQYERETPELTTAMLYLIALRIAAPLLLDEISSEVEISASTKDAEMSFAELEVFKGWDSEEPPEELAALYEQNPNFRLFINNLVNTSGIDVSLASRVLQYTSVSSTQEDTGADKDGETAVRQQRLVVENADLINLFEGWVHTIGEGDVRTSRLTTYWKYLVGNELEPFCSLSTRKKGVISIWVPVYEKLEGNALADEFNAISEPGVEFEYTEKGHWGRGNLGVYIQRDPWVKRGEVPASVRKLIERFYWLIKKKSQNNSSFQTVQ